MGNLLFQQARDAVANAVSCSSGAEQQDLVYRKTLCTLHTQTLQQLKKLSYVKCKSSCKTLRMHIKKRTSFGPL